MLLADGLCLAIRVAIRETNSIDGLSRIFLVVFDRQWRPRVGPWVPPCHNVRSPVYVADDELSAAAGQVVIWDAMIAARL